MTLSIGSSVELDPVAKSEVPDSVVRFIVDAVVELDAGAIVEVVSSS